MGQWFVDLYANLYRSSFLVNYLLGAFAVLFALVGVLTERELIIEPFIFRSWFSSALCYRSPVWPQRALA